MNRDRLRRYGLRVVAAMSLGVVLVVGIGVANAQTTSPDSGSGTVTIIRPVNSGPTGATADNTDWG